MFGMGLSEIFFIVVIAILFLGPDKLPDTMVQIAKFFKSIKQTIGNAKNSFEEELKISELKEEALRYKKQLDEATQRLEQVEDIKITSLDNLTNNTKDITKDNPGTTRQKQEVTAFSKRQETLLKRDENV